MSQKRGLRPPSSLAPHLLHSLDHLFGTQRFRLKRERCAVRLVDDRERSQFVGLDVGRSKDGELCRCGECGQAAEAAVLEAPERNVALPAAGIFSKLSPLASAKTPATWSPKRPAATRTHGPASPVADQLDLLHLVVLSQAGHRGHDVVHAVRQHRAVICIRVAGVFVVDLRQDDRLARLEEFARQKEIDRDNGVAGRQKLYGPARVGLPSLPKRCDFPAPSSHSTAVPLNESGRTSTHGSFVLLVGAGGDPLQQMQSSVEVLLSDRADVDRLGVGEMGVEHHAGRRSHHLAIAGEPRFVFWEQVRQTAFSRRAVISFLNSGAASASAGRGCSASKTDSSFGSSGQKSSSTIGDL